MLWMWNSYAKKVDNWCCSDGGLVPWRWIVVAVNWIIDAMEMGFWCYWSEILKCYTDGSFMPWVLIIDALKHEDVHMFKTTPDKVYAKSPSCSNMQLTAVLTIRLKKMTEEYKIQSYQRRIEWLIGIMPHLKIWHIQLCTVEHVFKDHRELFAESDNWIISQSI